MECICPISLLRQENIMQHRGWIEAWHLISLQYSSFKSKFSKWPLLVLSCAEYKHGFMFIKIYVNCYVFWKEIQEQTRSYICMQLVFNFCFNLFHVNSPVELCVLLHFENNLFIFCKQILSSSIFAIQYDAFLIKFSHAYFTIHFRKDDQALHREREYAQCFMGNDFSQFQKCLTTLNMHKWIAVKY